MSIYELPELLKGNEELLQTTDACPMWKCWQTGVKLDYLGACLLRVKEVEREDASAFCDYRQCRIQVEQQQDLGQVNVRSTSILEILLPNEALSVAFEKMPLSTSMTDSMFMNLVIYPEQQALASLLNKVVDHIDTLLEDWYPDLGARFVQNSKGMYLITRLVPCIRCLVIQSEIQNKRLESDHAWSLVDVNSTDQSPTITKPILITQNSNLSALGESCDQRSRDSSGSRVMRTSASANAMDAVSHNSSNNPVGDNRQRNPMGDNSRPGLYIENTTDDRYGRSLDPGLNSMAQSVPTKFIQDGALIGGDVSRRKPVTVDTAFGRQMQSNWDGRSVAAHLVEECMKRCHHVPYKQFLRCPLHGATAMHKCAPDVVFQDIGDEYLIDGDLISRGRFLGRGAFGAVYAGTLLDRTTEEEVAIAMKMMQPVAPDNDAPKSIQAQYKQDKEKWRKDPMKYSCEAYLNVRKELSILLSLQHEHIVPLLGISTHPMCLVLSLAPQGALNERLEDYYRKGVKLSVYAIHEIVKQVASALAYLHSNKIIYRDLKSENVLVWQLPGPDDLDEEQQGDASPVHDGAGGVHVKLADYGVSRSVLPWGTKGLAGTPPFMAPEIIQHNGEETYTEKVDCYSFGMFMYELLTQHTPFDSCVTTQGVGRFNRDSYIISGGRPPITYQECMYPGAMLDLMSICWAHDPGSRPSANQIKELASRAEFTQLCGTIPLTEHEKVNTCVCVPHQAPVIQYEMMFSDDEITEEDEDEEEQCDVWLALAPDVYSDGRPSLAVYAYDRHGCTNAKKRLVAAEILVMCVTQEHVWCADSQANIHIYSIMNLEEVLCFPIMHHKTGQRPTVQAMVYGSISHKVYIFIAQSSRFVVCTSVLPPPGESAVTMECPGNNKPVHCVALLSHNDTEELWCGHVGQKAGEISIWNMNTQHIRTVAHDKERDNRTVHLIVTDRLSNSSVYTYVYPGTEVYRWDVYSRQVTHVVDLAHVVPKHPTHKLAKHITKNFFLASKCQVVSMCIQDESLFVGTTLGCLVVLNKHTMNPLSIVQCNTDEQPIDVLLPLSFTAPQICDVDIVSTSSGESSNDDSCSTHLLSTCRGYTDVTSQVLPRYDVVRSQRAQHYMTLWRAHGWMTSAKQAFLQADDYVTE